MCERLLYEVAPDVLDWIEHRFGQVVLYDILLYEWY